MAEVKAAHQHLPRGAQPSIFTVLSAESLLSNLKPAVTLVLQQFSSNSVAHLKRYFEEIALVLESFLENHYLKHYDASFSEHFYGMKRVIHRGTSRGKPLDLSSKIKSLLFIVILPYIKRRFDRFYSSYEAGIKRVKSRFLKFILSVYPYLSGCWELWGLLLTIGYFLSFTWRHSPALILTGVRLENLTSADHNGEASNWLVGGFWKVVTVGLFFTQFLNWWYNEADAERWLQSASNSVIPPHPLATPEKLGDAEQFVQSLPRGVCPLCKSKRNNDAILQVSGYAFCYTCIYQYVANNQSCPVTNIPAENKHIMRLFYSNK